MSLVRLENTAAGWLAASTAQPAGAICRETDTFKVKIGDGSTVWSALPYQSADLSIDELVGLSLTAAATLSAGDARFGGNRRSVGSTSLGVPVGAVSRVSTANTAQQLTVGTSETPLQLNTKCTNIRYLLGAIQSSGVVDTLPTDAYVIGAGINIGTQASPSVYPLRVNGKTTINLDPGGLVWTDPLPVDIDPAVTVPRARIFTGGTSWYPNAAAYVPGQGGWTVTTDLSGSQTAIAEATSATLLLAPLAVYGEPLGMTGAFPTVLVVGDSIVFGQGDGSLATGINTVSVGISGGGMITRGLIGKAGVVNAACPGDSAVSFNTFGNRKYRALLLNSCANMVCNYGYNDLNTGQTVAQLQANLIKIWLMGANRNVRVFQTTINPNTTSTDGFLTLANQTIVVSPVKEALRVTFNQWLRAGAPLVAGAAAAIGTAGALLAGQSGHPLFAVVDTATVVESAQDSGFFHAADNVRTVADAGMTSGSAVISSATAAFTTADYGRRITVAGAGAAGVLFTGTINTVTSATQVKVGTTAGTTVTNAVCNIADGYTPDGTHPTGYGHAKCAALIATLPLAS